MTPQIYSYLHFKLRQTGSTASDNREAIRCAQSFLERDRENKIHRYRAPNIISSKTGCQSSITPNS